MHFGIPIPLLKCVKWSDVQIKITVNIPVNLHGNRCRQGHSVFRWAFTEFSKRINDPVEIIHRIILKIKLSVLNWFYINAEIIAEGTFGEFYCSNIKN